MPEEPSHSGGAGSRLDSAQGSPTRDQLRRMFADAWRKRLSAVPLTPLETTIADLIELHPQYQALVGDAAAAVAFEPTAPDAENPFLHLGLHMAVRDQVSVDLPPGVRDLRRRLEARYGDLHGAEHAMMEALADTLWEAQRSGCAADEVQYLQRVRARLSVA